jgi:putative ABC transport system permease protein
VGIFSVALVIILASSLKDTVKESLEKSFGYNIQYTIKDDAQTAAVQQVVNAKQIPGQEKVVPFSYSNVRLVSAGGVSAEELIARKAEKEKDSTGQNENFMIDFSSLIGFSPQATSSVVKITEGSLLNSDDQVILDKSIKEALGLKVGDVVVYQELAGDAQFSMRVAGFFETKSSLLYIGSTITTYNRMQTIKGHQNGFELNVSRGKVDEAIKYLETTFPGSSATDLSNVTAIINRLIDNFTAFPILLAFLSLIAGAVLIANNVALAVLERRTEMGVMKSIGADSSRVLAIINWETGLVGFMGGLCGFGLAAAIGSVLISLLGTEDNPAVLNLSPAVFWGMLALAVGLSLVATGVSAWSAAREKPLVVLRYE